MHPLTYELADLLEQAQKFVDDCLDVVDGPYGEPAPGPAMVLSSRIDEALAEFNKLADADIVECDLAADMEPADTVVSDELAKS